VRERVRVVNESGREKAIERVIDGIEKGRERGDQCLNKEYIIHDETSHAVGENKRSKCAVSVPPPDLV
jgi:hypothetical protein